MVLSELSEYLHSTTSRVCCIPITPGIDFVDTATHAAFGTDGSSDVVMYNLLYLLKPDDLLYLLKPDEWGKRRGGGFPMDTGG